MTHKTIAVSNLQLIWSVLATIATIAGGAIYAYTYVTTTAFAHADHVKQELSEKMDEQNAHIEMLDHKVEKINDNVVQLLTKLGIRPISLAKITLHDTEGDDDDEGCDTEFARSNL